MKSTPWPTSLSMSNLHMMVILTEVTLLIMILDLILRRVTLDGQMNSARSMATPLFLLLISILPTPPPMTSMTSNNKISLLSLNINGLCDQSKRLLVFRWLKTLSFSIILLQDVHFSATDLILWNQQWGYPAIWSYYNAILLTNPSMTLSTVPYPYTDRILCASIINTPNTPPISVGSIYLPANPSQ